MHLEIDRADIRRAHMEPTEMPSSAAPIAPSSINCFALPQSDESRSSCPTASSFCFCFASATSASQSPTVSAIGFSSNKCRPDSKAARETSKCRCDPDASPVIPIFPTTSPA